MHFLEVRRSVFSGHFISKCLLWSVVRGQFCTEIDHGLTTGCIDCTRVLCTKFSCTGIRIPVIFDFFKFKRKSNPWDLIPRPRRSWYHALTSWAGRAARVPCPKFVYTYIPRWRPAEIYSPALSTAVYRYIYLQL